MTQKEEFLKIQSYEEFDKKRDRFKGLKVDRDIKEHMKNVFPKIKPNKHDRPGLCLDPAFPLKKVEKQKAD